MSCTRRDGRHATRHLPCFAVSVLAGNSSPSSTIACSRILNCVAFPSRRTRSCMPSPTGSSRLWTDQTDTISFRRSWHRTGAARHGVKVGRPASLAFHHHSLGPPVTARPACRWRGRSTSQAPPRHFRARRRDIRGSAARPLECRADARAGAMPRGERLSGPPNSAVCALAR